METEQVCAGERTGMRMRCVKRAGDIELSLTDVIYFFFRNGHACHRQVLLIVHPVLLQR